jgi:recombination protein RecA
MAKNEAADKDKALNLALDHIKKQYGDGAIMKLGEDAARLQVDVISTGALTLDIALGVGGLPRGRVVEIYGQEGSGKTTLALHLMAETQRAGGIAAFIDAEHAFSREYAEELGIDLDSLLVSQPDTGEQGLDICETLVRTGAVDCVVIDSVAALVPSLELQGEMGDAHVGLQARLMSQALRKLAGAVSNTNTLVIFINQIREKIGVMFGNPETTPGGRALKFWSSVRLEMHRKQTIKVGTDILGSRVAIKVVKNKVAPPFRVAELDIIYGKGFSQEGCIIDEALALGIISKTGSWYSMGDERLGQGRENAIQLIQEQPDLALALENQVREAHHLPPAIVAAPKAELPLEVEVDEAR